MDSAPRVTEVCVGLCSFLFLVFPPGCGSTLSHALLFLHGEEVFCLALSFNEAVTGTDAI